MQNAHELSQPIWIVTHALWPCSRFAGSAEGNAAASSAAVASSTSTIGPLAGELDQIGGAMHVVGAEHHVDPRRLRADALGLVLGEASAHDDLHAGATVFDRLEHAEVAVELVVGVLPDAAAVEHHDVGVLGIGSRNETIGLEEAGDALGVVLVHLTPEGADEVRASHPLRLGVDQPANAPRGG